MIEDAELLADIIETRKNELARSFMDKDLDNITINEVMSFNVSKKALQYSHNIIMDVMEELERRKNERY